MSKIGFLTLLYNQQEEIVLALFLPIKSIQKPDVLQSIFDEVNSSIAEYYKEVYGRIENIPVYDFDRFSFYEYGLNKEEIYQFTEDEVYDSEYKLKKGLFTKHLKNIKKNSQKYIYPRNIVGAVARDNNFYDREEFIQDLWKILSTKNIFLSAPRRFGKTSIMYHLFDNPKEPWRVVHLELQHIPSPERFILELQQQFSSLFTLQQIPTRETWRNDGKGFFESISQEKIIFLFDEFLYMLENFKKNELVSEFSKWFLSQRQANPNCRFLIASSYSLNFCLKQYRIADDFPDFEEKRIPPFSHNTALEFIDELLLSENKYLEANLKEKILELVGIPVPYFIQIIMAEILNSKKPLTEQKIEEIYKQRILGPDCKQYFYYFFQRISTQGFDFQKIAYGLLKELSVCDYLSYSQLWELYKEISRREDKIEFESILAYLEDEFYINKDNGNYSFFCKVLKDWWRRQGVGI